MVRGGIVCCSRPIITCPQGTFLCSYGSQGVWSSVQTICLRSAFCDPPPCGMQKHHGSPHLSLRAACHSFAFTASHRIAGGNSIAGALPRFDFLVFIISLHSAGSYSFATRPAGPASGDLMHKCHFHLANGLAPSPCQVYCSA